MTAQSSCVERHIPFAFSVFTVSVLPTSFSKEGTTEGEREGMVFTFSGAVFAASVFSAP